VKDGRGARWDVRLRGYVARSGSKEAESLAVGVLRLRPDGPARRSRCAPRCAGAATPGGRTGTVGREGSARDGTEPPDGLTPGQAAGDGGATVRAWRWTGTGEVRLGPGARPDLEGESGEVSRAANNNLCLTGYRVGRIGHPSNHTRAGLAPVNAPERALRPRSAPLWWPGSAGLSSRRSAGRGQNRPQGRPRRQRQ